MYGSHRPPHYSPAESARPPQPEWQRPVPPPPSQNQPPQPQWHLSGDSNVHSSSNIPQAPPPLPPPPPPHPPQSAYNPQIYGPISGQQPPSAPTSPLTHQNIDTTTWGVKYNHNHGQAIPNAPPLPPRSGSAAPVFPSHSPPLPPPPPTTNPPENHITTQPSVLGAQSSWPAAPPPRPPVPPEYRVEMQQNSTSAPQSTSLYQGQPGAHHYDPPNIYSPPPQPPSQAPSGQPYYHSGHTPNVTVQQDQHAAQGQWSQPSQVQTSASYAVPAPYTSPTVITGASALGFGGPSDWEHYSSTPGYTDSGTSSPLPTQTPVSQISAELIAQQMAVAPAPTTHEFHQIDSTQQQTPRPSQQEQWIMAPPVAATDSKPPRPSSPPKPSRLDSISSRKSDVSAMDGNDPFEGIIQAWNQPISPVTKPQRDNMRDSPINLSEGQQISHQKTPRESNSPAKTPDLQISTKKTEPQGETTPAPSPPRTAVIAAPAPQSEPVVRKEIVDPYDDLDPWSKSSLARFATMLRKEAVAESDEDRYKIFTSFMVKETKLREVLYNVEPPHVEPPPVEAKPPPATPTQPPESPVRSKSLGAVPQIDSGLIPIESEQPAATVEPSSPDRTGPANSTSNDGDEAYSPGGRPILNIRPPTAPPPEKRGGLHRSASNPSAAYRAEAVSATPQGSTIHDNLSAFPKQDAYSRSASVPPSSMAQNLRLQTFSPLQSHPPQPAYVPFRYTEGPQRGSDVLVFDKPAYQAYSALRQASAESGRAMAAAAQAPAPSPSPKPGSSNLAPTKSTADETFLGIIREKSVSYRGKRLSTVSGGLLEELCALIPDPFPGKTPSQDHAAIRSAMEKFSVDFGYIEAETRRWDQNAARRLAGRDQERIARQEESERHIDDLFNDKAIGYADINLLEEEFRQKEARMQLDEEREELESFIRAVFAPLDSKLREEVVELKALVERATEALSKECAETNQNNPGKYQLSYLMNLLNGLSTKLELRYQKRLDLALDRERRRKKAERRPLVFLGESKALKKLDGDFDRMEKQNKVEAAKDRDERANKLMDAFDDAIMSGLGDHQKLIDGITAKAKKLDIEAIRSNPYPDSTREQILRSITALVNLVREDSESMLQSFGTADTMLNNADYNVSVAEARYSSASADVFHRLDEEKKKEDAKIQDDLTKKLNSVRKGPTEIVSKIDSLLVSMGKEPGPGSGPWGRPAGIVLKDDTPSSPKVKERKSSLNTGPVPAAESLMPGPRPPTTKPMTPAPLMTSGPVPVSTSTPAPAPAPAPPTGPWPATDDKDPKQQERLRKALEEAKRRNAAKKFST